jgi:hypothetical protein
MIHFEKMIGLNPPPIFNGIYRLNAHFKKVI